jgi:hypothetical protein
MLKRIYNRYGVLFFLTLGITIRLLIFYISPPSNSYDNHLEVINEYSTNIERPLPFSCWECYQPPVYYIVAALTYNTTEYVGFSADISWKLVQLINPLLSILTLLLILKILDLFGVNQVMKLFYLSFFIILPRDIFTSAMIGNDYLLVFLSIASLYFYFKYVMLGNEIRNYIYLSIFVLLGGLTKQHGLLLLLLPGSLLINDLKKSKKVFKATSIFISIIILLMLEEAWKFYNTGFLMVSNQHYFDYTINQFPGKLEKVEFFSFRLLSLFKDPFISDLTAASLPTEIFARIFFDYEYRFLSPKIGVVNNIGRFGYILGMIWALFFAITTWIKFKHNQITSKNILILYIPFLLGILFTLVPVIQTMRYPYFSSMKAMFLLPGLIILFISHAVYIKDIRIHTTILSTLTVLNLVYGIIIIIAVSLFVEVSLNHLHGPLWPIP